MTDRDWKAEYERVRAIAASLKDEDEARTLFWYLRQEYGWATLTYTLEDFADYAASDSGEEASEVYTPEELERLKDVAMRSGRWMDGPSDESEPWPGTVLEFLEREGVVEYDDTRLAYVPVVV